MAFTEGTLPTRAFDPVDANALGKPVVPYSSRGKRGCSVNIFDLRDTTIQDYRDFIGGFVNIRDARIRQVRAARDAGRVARDSRENETHTPATFSSISVVI